MSGTLKLDWQRYYITGMWDIGKDHPNIHHLDLTDFHTARRNFGIPQYDVSEATNKLMWRMKVPDSTTHLTLKNCDWLIPNTLPPSVIFLDFRNNSYNFAPHLPKSIPTTVKYLAGNSFLFSEKIPQNIIGLYLDINGLLGYSPTPLRKKTVRDALKKLKELHIYTTNSELEDILEILDLVPEEITHIGFSRAEPDSRPIPFKTLTTLFKNLPKHVSTITLAIQDIENLSQKELLELGKSLGHVKNIIVVNGYEVIEKPASLKYLEVHMGNQTEEIGIKNILDKYIKMSDITGVIIPLLEYVPAQGLDPAVDGLPRDHVTFLNKKEQARKAIKKEELDAQKLQKPQKPQKPQKLQDAQEPTKKQEAATHSSFQLKCLYTLAAVGTTTLLAGALAVYFFTVTGGVILAAVGAVGLGMALYGLFNPKNSPASNPLQAPAPATATSS